MRDSVANEEIKHLEGVIEEHDRAIDHLRWRRRDVKKKMKNPLLSLLVVLLITALLSSSCTLHAGELLGRWEADGVIGLWTGRLEGILEKAKSLGTAPYVIASVVLAVINLPVGLCGMFLTPLRMIEMLLEMNLPAAVTYLPYVEIALVLMVLWVVMKEVRPFSGNRSVKRELQDIDSRLRKHSRERQEAYEILKAVRKAEAVLKAAVEKPLTREEVDRHFEQMMDDRLQAEIAEVIPEGVNPAVLHRFYEKDPTKTYAVAAIIRDTLGPRLEQGSEGRATTEEEYLAGFERVFQGIRDEDVSPILAYLQQIGAVGNFEEGE